MSEQPGLPPRAKWRDLELTDAEIQDVLRPSRRSGRRRTAAIAALELAGATRLKAQSKLREDAANVVLAKWPRYCDDIEQVLWPAFSEYSRTVFDEIARSRSDSLASRFSLRRYTHWLRCTCIAAVVDEDVCHPSGQLFVAVQHVIDVIGDTRRFDQIDETKRALYRMLTDFLGGPYVQNLGNRLRAHLYGRAAYWDGEAMERILNLSQAQTMPTSGRITKSGLPASLGEHAVAPDPGEASSSTLAIPVGRDGQERVDGPVSTSSAGVQRRKRGPERDYKTAARVAEVVNRTAPDGDWRSKLDEVLMALDDKGVGTPKTWGPRHGYRNWYGAIAADSASRGRHLAIEAIKHHLKRANEAPAETIT